MTVAGTTAQWSAETTKFGLRQAIAARTVGVSTEMVELTVSAAARRRTLAADPAVSRRLQDGNGGGVSLNIGIVTSSTTMVQAITADFNVNLANPGQMSEVLQAALPGVEVEVLSVSPVATESRLLTSEDIDRMPSDFVMGLTPEGEGDDDKIQLIIVTAATTAGVVLCLLALALAAHYVCKRRSKRRARYDPRSDTHVGAGPLQIESIRAISSMGPTLPSGHTATSQTSAASVTWQATVHNPLTSAPTINPFTSSTVENPFMIDVDSHYESFQPGFDAAARDWRTAPLSTAPPAAAPLSAAPAAISRARTSSRLGRQRRLQEQGSSSEASQQHPARMYPPAYGKGEEEDTHEGAAEVQSYI